jgi:predicted phosphodiesterase
VGVQAVISDIHGNHEALKTTLAYIKANLDVDEIVCLGDIVGYGPWPQECVDTIMANCSWCLVGNHDVALLSQAFGFNRLAKEAIDWQRECLRPQYVWDFKKKKQWGFLENNPDRKKFEDSEILYVHASPRDPVMEYVEESDCMDMGFGPGEKILEIMSLIKRICFVGHSHRPGIVTADHKWIKPAELENATYTIPPGSKALCNIGSVGQPRDEDPRSCFVTFDRSHTVQFHRVEYDIDTVVNTIKGIDRLDVRLGERLRVGR